MKICDICKSSNNITMRALPLIKKDGESYLMDSTTTKDHEICAECRNKVLKQIYEMIGKLLKQDKPVK